MERAHDYTAVLARLESWLGKHRPHFLHDLRAAATVAELDELQAKIGIALPAGLRTLLHWHNGQREDSTGSLVERWRLMGSGEIVAARGELNPRTNPASGWNAAWIPFLEDDDGDYMFLDTSRPEPTVHEFWLGKPEHPAVAGSLSERLESFVAAVERGEYVEDPERGDFLRRHDKSFNP
jgi:cell wall assembly regulator SMI1